MNIIVAHFEEGESLTLIYYLLIIYNHLLQILSKWGEYSNDVQFILQRSAFDGTKPQQQLPARLKITEHGSMSTPAPISPPDRNKDIRKSLTFSGGHHVTRTGDNVGVVKARPRLEVNNTCYI